MRRRGARSGAGADDDGGRYAVVVQVAAEQVATVPDAGWLTGIATQVLEVLGEEED